MYSEKNTVLNTYSKMWYNFKQLHKFNYQVPCAQKIISFYKNIKRRNRVMTLHLTGSCYHTAHSSTLCCVYSDVSGRVRTFQAVQIKKSRPAILRASFSAAFDLLSWWVIPCPLGFSRAFLPRLVRRYDMNFTGLKGLLPDFCFSWDAATDTKCCCNWLFAKSLHWTVTVL